MKRRPYTAVERQRSVEVGRDRIVAAARELLDDEESEGFSIDAVARRAGVARMTVYNQFESKAGLLEALFDSLAQHGPLGQMADVFRMADPLEALDEYVALFGRFWATNRRTHRRVRAAALYDDELAAAIGIRNERRRRGIAEILRRLPDTMRPTIPRDELPNVLFILLSFDTFDALAGTDRTPEDVVPTVRAMVRALAGLPAG